MRQTNQYLRAVPPLCIGILLVAAFRLYTFSYFWLDDFSTLHAVHQWSMSDVVSQVFSASTVHFRPVGLLFHKVAFYLFDRDPVPYHVLMLAIHALNVALVYLILKAITESRPGAFVGAMLFAYTPVFNDLFWSFGTIFELVGAAFFFAGLLLWHRQKRSLSVVLLSSVFFILSLKTKEMGITLPAIWLVHDLMLRRPLKLREMAYFILPVLVGAWYASQKLLQMRAPNPVDPYYMDVSATTMGHGYSYYLNALFETTYRWQIWSIGFVALLLLLGLLRWRLALFFQAYVFVAFLPLIFLDNHRDPFYWYFPMLGVCGLAALLAKAVSNFASSRIPERWLAPVGAFAFALLCWVNYVHSRAATEERRMWQQGIAKDYRGFVETLPSLGPLDPQDTFYFKSVPVYFNEDALQFASEFALGRTDIEVEIVEDFPAGAKHRLAFENSKVVAQ